MVLKNDNNTIVALFRKLKSFLLNIHHLISLISRLTGWSWLYILLWAAQTIAAKPNDRQFDPNFSSVIFLQLWTCFNHRQASQRHGLQVYPSYTGRFVLISLDNVLSSKYCVCLLAGWTIQEGRAAIELCSDLAVLSKIKRLNFFLNGMISS